MDCLFSRLWQCLATNRQTAQRPIIVVSGLPRSGTSMMMHMLAAGGMEMVTDQLRQADENNPNGYFEFEKVKSLTEDASWMGIACGKAIKIIASLLPYLPSAYTYKVILMERNLQEVLASQQTMLRHRGEDTFGPDDETIGERLTQNLNDVKAWLEQQAHIDVLVVRHAVAMSDRHNLRLVDRQAIRLHHNAFCHNRKPVLLHSMWGQALHNRLGRACHNRSKPVRMNHIRGTSYDLINPGRNFRYNTSRYRQSAPQQYV